MTQHDVSIGKMCDQAGSKQSSMAERGGQRVGQQAPLGQCTAGLPACRVCQRYDDAPQWQQAAARLLGVPPQAASTCCSTCWRPTAATGDSCMAC